MDRTKWSNEQLTRTMVFTTLVFSNVILSLVNRSFYSVFASLKNKNNMMVIANLLTLLSSLIVYISPIAFFDVLPLQLDQIVICIAVSAVSVLWIEIWKWNKRKNNTQPRNIKS
jgi:Ca2+-transporting ATPase